MPVFRDISRTVMWVRGWSSWLKTISFTWSMFRFRFRFRFITIVIIRAGTSQSVAALTSVHCAHVSGLLSNLLMLRVHPLCGNSVLNQW